MRSQHSWSVFLATVSRVPEWERPQVLVTTATVEIDAEEHPGLRGEAYRFSALPSKVFEAALVI